MAKAKVRKMENKDWEEFGDKIGATIENEFKKHHKSYVYTGPGIGFPLLILLIGIFLLASSQGWIPADISLWPILFIAFGLWVLVGRLWKRKW